MNKENNLINESSPYLLQHAKNPVNWNPWDKKYLNIAEKQNKLVIISIGYASCHWCHVMERESFQDSAVAKLMNEKFISLKVDREERPDIDQVYMNAIQLMTGSGGWPLNVIALPDGRPIWGGTYFSKEQWLSALNQISVIYEKEPEKFTSYADKVQEGINSLNIVDPAIDDFESIDLLKYSEKLIDSIDLKFGGFNGAPKFMMPNNLDFLLRYSVQESNLKAKNIILESLEKIAYGGIFDHIEGGFSRYSTDEKWHIPHFEKMLYDNAQLMSLYSKGFKVSNKKHFKKVVYKIHEYINKEMKDNSGGFYSSLDAELFDLDSNTKLIDTPGIKGFGLVNFKKEEISDFFPEFLSEKNKCKFSNCLHFNEPNCRIKEMVKKNIISDSRYENYIHILNDENLKHR